MTLAELKKSFSTHLSETYTESENAFIFQIFAEHLLGLNAIQQRQSADQEISSENEEKFGHIISELKTGKPYLQILGETEFYGMKFFVDENVLIPRPETEELLEIAIREIKKYQNLPSAAHVVKILDIGTGSGIIPLVLKKHFPETEVSSMDFSEKALETAKRNAAYHQLDVTFIHADYLNTQLTEEYDIIISNPPYIGIEEETEIADSVKGFEPVMALFSPTSDALIFYRKIAEDAKEHLKNNGLLFLEINQKLGPETLELYKDFSDAQLLKDLSENDRFIYGRK
ncbi:peptide chain release factor N(5)-glutamine methyltransferase [Chryseobacterium sp. BIGb0232]|uniref:peptide chain release factor N(5)-glutamine methyltransferase n=1 Tax=Chryseobacterium sp. BIGb0232 TaxID=2940598 RepID=UPI000F47FFAA|nr:peptide chain release factor N(5)-glutamine methyltransferase [Chryseobacterium sp. BIGb0232]MCS4300575.1 release factor glutamine methyltransferase [Chryseobacterium sp. BIGb0232]ROS20539.1 release factor glutamine methyltransferase [Chryseobacterium nakagawai]